jgi:hypothetical protein
MGKIQAKKGKGHKGMRSAKNKASGYYVQQRFKTEKNRKRKRQKHLSLHPNDIQTLEALKKML